MLSYDQTMRLGATAYADVIDALRQAGVPVSFTQTGGMNAALDAHLDGGAYLLITDADDALSWDRDEQDGWGVGLYTNDEDQELLAHRATDSTSTEVLVELVHQVLRQATSRGA